MLNQNTEMRTESNERETVHELNDSDWEQALAASVNLSQNISVTPNITLLYSQTCSINHLSMMTSAESAQANSHTSITL